MAHRPRIVLANEMPSTVSLAKNGRRSTEKLLLEADGINAMANPDGSITIEAYNQSSSILLRLTPDDVRAQAHVLLEWSKHR